MAGTAQAQDADPLADEEAWKAGVTRELLTGSLEARERCNQLVDDVNDLARQWEAVRVGTLDSDSLDVAVDDAERLWRRHRAACEGAITQLPAGAITESVLTYQRQQLDTVWRPLVDLCRAWLAGANSETLAQHAGRYTAELRAYAGWLEGAAVFWDGAYLDQEESPPCLVDVRKTALTLAREIRAQMVVPPAQRDPVDIQQLRGRHAGLAKSIVPCRQGGGLGDLHRIELDLLDEQLGTSHLVAIDGLAFGDPLKLKQAMDAEQRITERLMRCRAEYSADPQAVSAECTP